jgi:hypothetical protein
MRSEEVRSISSTDAGIHRHAAAKIKEFRWVCVMWNRALATRVWASGDAVHLSSTTVAMNDLMIDRFKTRKVLEHAVETSFERDQP